MNCILNDHYKSGGTMNRSICTLLLATVMGAGVALADNPSTMGDQTPQKPDQKQFMKDCMAKAKAANNGMSEQDMKKSCKDQLKASMGNPPPPVTPAH
jgi:hypothetical protein